MAISELLRSAAVDSLGRLVGFDEIKVDRVDTLIDSLIAAHPELTRQDALDIGVKEGVFPTAEAIEQYRLQNSGKQRSKKQPVTGGEEVKRFCAVLQNSASYAGTTAANVQQRHGVILSFMLQGMERGKKFSGNEIRLAAQKVDSTLTDGQFWNEVSLVKAVVNYFFPNSQEEKEGAAKRASEGKPAGAVLRKLLEEGYESWEQLKKGEPGKEPATRRTRKRSAGKKKPRALSTRTAAVRKRGGKGKQLSQKAVRSTAGEVDSLIKSIDSQIAEKLTQLDTLRREIEGLKSDRTALSKIPDSILDVLKRHKISY